MEFSKLFIFCTQLVFVHADIYSILGLEKTASNCEIKQAYRKLALQYHPDRNTEIDTTKKFIEITNAYTTLIGTHASFESIVKKCKNCKTVNKNKEKIKKIDDFFDDISEDTMGFNLYMDDVQQMSAEDFFNL